ncbi:hypothetical protein FHS48_001693 [Novispirillum itersonii]|uniref:Uncharacterized protein n=1 Tax=Novispirillum itersonii TaxID=189 RepID=A0A7W9ZF03_NOVIT|nr:hypothetical protein [Novispirillum itersonii]
MTLTEVFAYAAERYDGGGRTAILDCCSWVYRKGYCALRLTGYGCLRQDRR